MTSYNDAIVNDVRIIWHEDAEQLREINERLEARIEEGYEPPETNGRGASYVEPEFIEEVAAYARQFSARFRNAASANLDEIEAAIRFVSHATFIANMDATCGKIKGERR